MDLGRAHNPMGGFLFVGGWVDYYDNYLILNKKISFNNKWVISISH